MVRMHRNIPKYKKIDDDTVWIFIWYNWIVPYLTVIYLWKTETKTWVPLSFQETCIKDTTELGKHMLPSYEQPDDVLPSKFGNSLPREMINFAWLSVLCVCVSMHPFGYSMRWVISASVMLETITQAFFRNGTNGPNKMGCFFNSYCFKHGHDLRQPFQYTNLANLGNPSDAWPWKLDTIQWCKTSIITKIGEN